MYGEYVRFNIYKFTRICTCMHTCMYAYMYVWWIILYGNIHKFICIRTCVHTCMYGECVCINVYKCACMRTNHALTLYIHTCVRTYMHAYESYIRSEHINIYIHIHRRYEYIHIYTYIHTYIHIYIIYMHCIMHTQIYIRADIHTCTSVYTHIRIHTYTYIQWDL
jgi:hypothetical protein